MGPGTPRYPIELLRRLRPHVAVRVAGRVVVSADDSACIEDDTGRITASFVVGASLAAVRTTPAGAWVMAEGTWDGDRIRDARIECASPPAAAFPRSEGEWRWYRGPEGRLRNLRLRARLLRGVRAFFDARDFLEVETPLMVPSPGLDEHLDAFPIAEASRWLITSPEYQMKRLLAAGAPRIVQTCRCFRRGEHGRLHEPEFTMVEWYRAFAGFEAVMGDTEALVAELATALHGAPVLPGREGPIDLTPPWERMRVEDAFRRLAHVELAEVLPDETRFFRILVESIEPKLGRSRPVFLTHYPASMASLARLDPSDKRWAERVEAYIDGVELCNGFGELTDAHEQRARLVRDQRSRRARQLPAYPLDERFLAALEEGIPECAGNALGFDRLVMLLLGAATVEDVVAIPHARL